jgi:hypothetical protein
LLRGRLDLLAKSGVEGTMAGPIRRLLFVGLFVSVLILVGCQSPAPSVPATVEEVPRIRAPELRALLDAGEPVVIVDTRGRQLYDQRHISGAISVPEQETDARQGELPRDSKIVLYCT